MMLLLVSIKAVTTASKLSVIILVYLPDTIINSVDIYRFDLCWNRLRKNVFLSFVVILVLHVLRSCLQEKQRLKTLHKLSQGAEYIIPFLRVILSLRYYHDKTWGRCWSIHSN